MSDHNGHHHDHDHNHHSVSVEQATSKAFIIGIVLNLIYVIVEVVSGFVTNSLALITDAGHNFGDVVGLGLSLLAFRLAKVKPTKTFTYGYKKTTILAALVNATILLIAIGVLGYESVQRLRQPAPVQGGTVAWIAGIGIIINTISALLFFKSSKHELNARGAYLHLAADALVSAAVVVAGIIITYTHWYWLDPVVSLVVLAVILVGTWSLLTSSLRLSLDAVPKEIDIAEVGQLIKKAKGVQDVHHIHVWAISTIENALTAHVILDARLTNEAKEQVIKNVKHDLVHHSIQHTTLEIESNAECRDIVCEPK